MIATRFLPPLAVVAAFAVPAVLLRPARVAVTAEPAVSLQPEPPPPPPRPLTLREREALGCFLEWDERGGSDTTMTVRVDIDPDGSVLVTSHGGPDYPPLRTCVEETIVRTQYPIGHTLSLHLNVEWRAKRLQISPDLIEPYTGPKIGMARQKLEELKREQVRIKRELAKHRARHH